eukprot:7748908-Lingulodinium_polyedra.AAC.1
MKTITEEIEVRAMKPSLITSVQKPRDHKMGIPRYDHREARFFRKNPCGHCSIVTYGGRLP